jgi:uncharacterized protein YjiS (DUF1127 family)
MSTEVNHFSREMPRYSLRGPKGFLARVVRAFRDLNDYNDLENMSDYQLKDMGITRGQISQQRRETLRWPYV